MTLSDLITALLEIDLEDPDAGDREVNVEWNPDDREWYVVVEAQPAQQD
jgi:hypothetical protein